LKLKKILNYLTIWGGLIADTTYGASLGTSYADSHRFCFGQLGVLGKLCSKSKLSAQRLAFGHRCILQCPICEAGENGVLLAADTLGISLSSEMLDA